MADPTTRGSIVRAVQPDAAAGRPHHRDQVHRLLTQHLTAKAVRWASCAVDDMDAPPVPLHAGGHLRIDLEGLDRYLATFVGYGVSPDERGAITRPIDLVDPPADRSRNSP